MTEQSKCNGIYTKIDNPTMYEIAWHWAIDAFDLVMEPKTNQGSERPCISPGC